MMGRDRFDPGGVAAALRNGAATTNSIAFEAGLDEELSGREEITAVLQESVRVSRRESRGW